MDVGIAGELGFTIKLLAVAKTNGDRIEARVHPTMVPSRHLLATVGGVYNAIYLRGDAVGPTLLYGLGAGSLPTASAVVGDLMELARRRAAGAPGPVPLGIGLEPAKEILPMDEVVCPYYIRFMSIDRPGVLAAIAGILARYQISIDSVIQKGREVGKTVAIVMMTHEASEAAVRQALDEIGRLPVIRKPPVFIRVERED
jgi:homoserine dehydrogenase